MATLFYGKPASYWQEMYGDDWQIRVDSMYGSKPQPPPAHQTGGYWDDNAPKIGNWAPTPTAPPPPAAKQSARNPGAVLLQGTRRATAKPTPKLQPSTYTNPDLIDDPYTTAATNYNSMVNQGSATSPFDDPYTVGHVAANKQIASGTPVGNTVQRIGTLSTTADKPFDDPYTTGHVTANQQTTPNQTVANTVVGPPAPPGGDTPAASPWDAQAAMAEWEKIFGEDNKRALTGANEALDYQISGMGRRQEEMNAMRGGAATGGGYQSGAAQAALSAGAAKGQMSSQFYQRQQAQKQSFLQQQLALAEARGESEKANQIRLAISQVEMLGTLGMTQADTGFYNQMYAD